MQIFDLECHGQAPLKIVFVKFGDVFMKLWKLKSLQPENKKFDRHKNLVFSLHMSFPVLWISDDIIRLEFGKLFSWIQINMVFKSSRSSVFTKQLFSRILTGKKLRQIKLQRFQKVQIWVFGLLVQQINSLKEVLTETKFSKNKVVTGKTPFFMIGPFCSHHFICLNIGFWHGSFV